MARLSIRNVKRGLPLVTVPLSQFRIGGAVRNVREAYAISSSRLFDNAYYLGRYPDVDQLNLHPIVHYVLYGAREGRDPNRHFDTRAYVRKHLNGSADRVNPLYHFVVNRDVAGNGQSGELPPARSKDSLKSFIDRDILTPCPAFPHAHMNERIGTVGKRKILFVGHEASRTGAPIILLRLMEHYARTVDAELILVLQRGGELLPEYTKIAHVIREDAGLDMIAHHMQKFRMILGRFADPRPEFAVANTACVYDFLDPLHDYKIPIVHLIHEYLTYWPRECVERMYKNADVTIFPSRATQKVANDYVPLNGHISKVIPQGLLREGLLLESKNSLRAAALKELEIPPDSFVVLGVGTLDLRKGVDRFISIAFSAFEQLSEAEKKKLHFVWMGGPHHMTPKQFDIFCDVDIRNAGLERNIHFVGSKINPDRFFGLANLLLISSRADPFPCVVHEAMALGVPVMTFEGSGGAPEAVADGGGYVFPYGALHEAGTEIIRLHRNPEAAMEEGEKGKAIVREKYSFGEYFKKISDVVARDLVTDISTDVAQRSQRRDIEVPRVIIAMPDVVISGVNTFTFALSDQLRRMGMDVELLYTRDQKTEGDALHLDTECRVRHLAPYFIWGEDLWERLLGYLRSQAPCVFIPNYDYWASAVCPALPDSVGTIGIVHSDDIEHYEHAYRLGRYWNAMVCVSEHISNRVGELNPLFKEKITKIPYGISGAPSRYRRRERTASEPIRLIYTGRLIQHQKRIRAFVPIVEELDRRKVPYRLTLVGSATDEKDEAYLRTRFSAHLKDGRVRMPGRLPYEQVLELLEMHDVLVLTSGWEGLSLALLEGMAHGCVPVVSRIESGVGEVIQEGVNGFTIPIDDTGGYVDQFEWLQQNPERQDALGEKAHATIAARYTDRHMAERYAALIKNVYGDIVAGRFHREPSIHYLPYIGHVAPPPEMQLHRHQIRTGRSYWDLDGISRR